MLSDFYKIGHSGVSADASGNLVDVHDAPRRSAASSWILLSRRSTNGGLMSLARTTLSPASEQSTAPVVESRGTGDVHMCLA